jgi:hypothetical protein
MSAVEYVYPVERWQEYSYAFQISNIGTELGRAIECKKKRKYESMYVYLHEVMWQINYTLKDPKNESKIEELSKAKSDVYKYFGSPRYWYLKKRIIRFFDSYLYEYAEEASTKKAKEE